MRHQPLDAATCQSEPPSTAGRDRPGTWGPTAFPTNQPSWLMTLGVVVIVALLQGCAAVQARSHPLPPYPAYQLMRTPDGYVTWHQRWLALNWDLLVAQDRYERDHSLEGVRAYAGAVQNVLDHGAILYWAHQYDGPPNAPDKNILATIEVIAPYLKMMAGRLMTIAEAAAKQGDTTTGAAIAAHLLSDYPDLALGVVRQQAESFLVRHHAKRD